MQKLKERKASSILVFVWLVMYALAQRTDLDLLLCGKGSNVIGMELWRFGNAVHMHWHFFPRRVGDTPVKGPVWKLDKSEMYDEKYRPTAEELEELKAMLLTELDKLL